MGRIGVIVDHPEVATPGFGIYTGAEGKIGNFPLRSAEDVCTLAHKMGLDGLWVLPGTRLSFRAGSPDTVHDLIASNERIDVRSHLTKKDKVTCLHVWRREGTWEDKRTIRVLFPEHDPRWGPLQTLRDFKHVYTVVTRLENALGIDLDWSPGHTGKSLMIASNQGERASWLDYASLEGMPITHDTISKDGKKKYYPDMALKELDSSRPIYFHTFDKNYAYGACMTSVNLGQGAPEHYNALNVCWDEKYPGMWRIKNQWYWTPELSYLFASAGDIYTPGQIEEAWIWTMTPGGKPRYHQTLRPYAEKLHLIASTCNDEIMKTVSKEIRSQSGGWLAHQRKHDEPDYAEKDTLYRPDWWWMIVSELRKKMQWKIETLYKKGYHICWWNVDQIGFLSNDPNYRTAGHDIMYREKFGSQVDTSKELGGFKHSYTLLLDDEILHALSDDCEFGNAHKILLAKERLQRKAMYETVLETPALKVNHHA